MKTLLTIGLDDVFGVASSMVDEIFILGSASGVPTKNRFCTSIGISVDRSLYLFDCGAPCSSLLQRMGYNPLDLKAVFISHFHADHVADLPLLIQTLQLKDRRDVLEILGPRGTSGKILKILEYCYLFPEVLPFKVDVREVGHGQVYDRGELKVQFFENSHLKWYQRYSENYPELTTNALGFIIRLREHKIIYTGDVGRSEVEPYLTECSILIHEFGHHPLDEIGTIAERNKVSKLVITHIHPDWDENKKEIEENIRRYYSGQVVVADDGTRIPL
ncbi:MAG: MBL fold metallo-hydrolase [Candidatus Bathyarchaeia archaeon]